MLMKRHLEGAWPFVMLIPLTPVAMALTVARFRFQHDSKSFSILTKAFKVSNSSFCGYIFPADKKWLQNELYERYEGLLSDLSNPFDREFRFAPLVLEWEFISNSYHRASCTNTYDGYNPTFADNINGILLESAHDELDYQFEMIYSNYSAEFESLFDDYLYEVRNLVYDRVFSEYVSSRGYCSCCFGYEGNPYSGCNDIDECSSNSSLNLCPSFTTCLNVEGGFECMSRNSDGYFEDENDRFRFEDENDGFRSIIKITSIVIGSVVGALILLTTAWKSGKAFTKLIKVIKASRKYMFYKRNGGLLLEQQLAAIDNGLKKTKLFSSGELAKATDDYNENRILGRGGEGVVFKGMLEDGRIVAVKKTERVNQGDIEDFINEVVIVSQINHRNVVKLLGCCLESEVPRLVYEFIPNGTLFHHIHDPHKDFPLFWEIRVRIANEVAGALAYLHSAASVPIYHRDIKSTNILLDEKYRAKISDFGTSRSASIDQTHVTTRVVGTFGYLDPEYFQSNHFTEKSDVYSFGVVLVELLTGEKAISAVRVEEGRGLAMHFLLTMDQNQLFGIVDARVLREGKREEIEAMAQIARRCLHLNGKSRPTMKEVARQLEGIQIEREESEFSQNQIESKGCSSADEDDDISTISGISIDFQIITSVSPDTQHPLLDEP